MRLSKLNTVCRGFTNVLLNEENAGPTELLISHNVFNPHLRFEWDRKHNITNRIFPRFLLNIPHTRNQEMCILDIY